jgi:predicted enzyme related to lactoylglutathione lyase
VTLRILQIDVPEPDHARVTAFWSAALSATPIDAPGAFTHLRDATSAVEVHVQAIGSAAARYHLDLEAADRDAEVARLVDLGARELRRFDDGYTVLTDPSDQPFCVVDPDAATPTPVAPRAGSRGYLDAVLFDVPVDRVEAEVGFWSQALDTGVRASDDPSWPYTTLTDVRGPGGPMTIEVQAIDGPPRMHVDLSTPDVAAESARLEGLGATRIAAIDTWIVLADPVGNLLCVVPAREGSPT